MSPEPGLLCVNERCMWVGPTYKCVCVFARAQPCPTLCVSVCLCVCLRVLSHVQLFGVPWTVTHQAPLTMVFSRQEHWSGLPFPLPDSGIEPASLVSPTLAGGFFTTDATQEAPYK